MLTILLMPAVIVMTTQTPIKELGINYFPLGSNGLNVPLSPTMLGEKPQLILSEETKISNLIAFLTKSRTEKCLSPQFIHFVFRFRDKVVYVDCDGIVQGFGKNYIVNPDALEKLILGMGFPSKEPNKAIPAEWE